MPKRPHEPQLHHLIHRGEVLNGVAGVIMGGNRKGEFLRRLGTRTVSIVLNGPASRARHPLSLSVARTNDREPNWNWFHKCPSTRKSRPSGAKARIFPGPGRHG